MKHLAILIAAATLWLTAVASAQTTDPGTPGASPIDADRAVLSQIVMSSVAQVQQCALAADKTQSPAVRSFCRSAVNDAQQTALAGLQLAKKIGASEVKFAPSPATPAVLDSLTQYSGHDFDRAFLLRQIEDHENDQEELRYAADVATNVAVKRYEDSVLPRVEKDLQLAEGTLDSISTDGP